MSEIHLKEPSADYIVKFARRMEKANSDQDRLDDIFADIDNMTHRLQVATKKDGGNPETMRAGMIGRQNKKEAAILSIIPFAHFNPPSTDKKDIDHANRLEAFIAGAIPKSQKVGDSWGEVPGKGVRTGRAWEETIVDPQAWAGPDFKKQAEAVKKAKAGTREEAEKKLEMMKRDNWPVITKEVETRNTWTYFSGAVWLPEVIQIRMMSRESIRSAYGDKALSGRSPSEADTTKIKVLIFSNHKWSKTVVSGKTPKIAHFFDHDMGMNPLVLGEFVRAPENKLGIRWQPSAYHAKEMSDALDEALSDWRTSQRENTLAQPVIYFDKEEYDAELMEDGRPAQIDIEPGGPMIALWNTEKAERFPGTLMNEQASFYLTFLRGLVESEIKQPAQQGEFKSGTSNNLAVTASQLAERDFNPMMKALRKMWHDKTVLIMRAVVRMNKEFPSRPDKLSVYDPRVTGKGFIDIGPDGVIGQEGGIQVRAERAVPIERVTAAALVQRLTQIGYDPETAMERELGEEDAPAITEKRRRFELEELVFQKVTTQLALERAIQVQQALSPAEQQELIELQAGASPELNAALQPEEASPTGQADANILRTGSPQNPQGTGRVGQV